VLARLSDDAVTDTYQPPAAHAEIEQIDCMYVPRIQAVVTGQTIDIKNGDATMHNVHTYRGTESWFNKAQVKGWEPIPQELPDEPKIIKFTCDVHPWMRGFVVVSPHPFFAVSGQGGGFSIKRVPAGTFTIEAWHSRFGRVKIVEGQTVAIGFAYTGTDSAPAENSDEDLL
jgi:plastocyanin